LIEDAIRDGLVGDANRIGLSDELMWRSKADPKVDPMP
jgi:hypothetical protein